MSGRSLDLAWNSPGPVSDRYMAARNAVDLINGPIGSAKTTTSQMKLINLASEQAPALLTKGAKGRGVRLFKACVVRDTYRQLWRTTLPSWWARMPRDVGTFTGAENAPASHAVAFLLDDGTEVRFQADFVAIGDQSVEDVLRGYEPTAFYLNELDLLAQEVFTYAVGRTGRYPRQEEGGPSWHGIIADCNAPELEGWLYDQIFMKTPGELAAMGIGLHVQPGGMDPGAENLANLPGGREYYERQMRINPEWYIQRMIHNRPGFSRAGKPIYDDYNDLTHCAREELAVLPGLPVLVGLDAGLDPSAIFTQRTPDGGWRVIDELVGEHGTGPNRFGDMMAAHMKHPRFESVRVWRGWADPSAAYGADKKNGEKDWIEIIAAKTGIRITGAPSNKPSLRWDAVKGPLQIMKRGGPSFQLSPICRMLRRGFNSEYHFRKVVGTERFSEEANKNAASHPHDALQYVMLGAGERSDVFARHEGHRKRVMETPVENAWDPFA